MYVSMCATPWMALCFQRTRQTLPSPNSPSSKFGSVLPNDLGVLRRLLSQNVVSSAFPPSFLMEDVIYHVGLTLSGVIVLRLSVLLHTTTTPSQANVTGCALTQYSRRSLLK